MLIEVSLSWSWGWPTVPSPGTPQLPARLGKYKLWLSQLDLTRVFDANTAQLCAYQQMNKAFNAHTQYSPIHACIPIFFLIMSSLLLGRHVYS